MSKRNGQCAQNEIADKTKLWDDERKYLEGLLKDRFNFFVLFSSLLFAGVAGAERMGAEETQAAWLVAGIVSLAIWLSVIRTRSLVRVVLEEIRKDANHPYTHAVDRSHTSGMPTSSSLG